MNAYRATVKLVITKTITKNVEVQATDADKAKLQLEAMYGKENVVSYPMLLYSNANSQNSFKLAP